MSTVIHVLAQFKIQSEHIETARNIFAKLIQHTQQEEGCLSYMLLNSMQDNSFFTFVERWASEDALKKHEGSAHLIEAVSNIGSLLVQAPDVQTYREV